MRVITRDFSLSTRGFGDTLDITPQVQEILEDSGLSEGSLTVFVPGSTGAVTTIEFESGVISDLKRALERLVPQDMAYEHDLAWGDGNGFSHVRAALMKPSLSIPFKEGRLLLGTWQQVVFLDFDNRPRRRRLVVQLIGE
ncbi:MAG TPA: YjbQ family protein [Thermodesulfatator sp.]|nr:YjbQ family protein [Thermodesulfatator sp.]